MPQQRSIPIRSHLPLRWAVAPAVGLAIGLLPLAARAGPLPDAGAVSLAGLTGSARPAAQVTAGDSSARMQRIEHVVAQMKARGLLAPPLPTPAAQPARPAPDLITVHVRPFRVMTPTVPPAFGLSITAALAAVVHASGRYVLVSPTPVVRPVTDPRGRPTPGRATARQVEVWGEVVRRTRHFPDRVPELTLARVQEHLDHKRFEVGTLARVIDVGSGEILASAFIPENVRYKDLRKAHIGGHRPYALDPSPRLGGDLADQAASIAHGILDLVDASVAAWPPTPVRPRAIRAHIVRVDPQGPTISAGTARGVLPGGVLEVYRPGPSLVDPESGELLGRQETLVGHLRITEVTRRTAVGVPMPLRPFGEPPTFRRGDVVRQ